MSESSVSRNEKIGSLSRERAELLSRLLEKRAARTPPSRPSPRVCAPGETLLPLSWAQERLWFIDKLERAGAAYYVPLAVRLRGTLHCECLHKALDTIVARHEALRSVFVNVQGIPRQRITPEGHVALTFIDLENQDTRSLEDVIGRHKSEEAETPFDLATGPLIRGRLLRVSATEHVLLLTLHHIVSDGWSLGVLVRELTALYAALTRGEANPLEPLPLQYADYALWQRQWSRGDELTAQLRFWKERLAGAPPALELPTDKPRPTVPSYHGDRVALSVGPLLTAKLKTLASQHRMTLFMLLYSAWALLMSRLSNQEDVVIGAPVGNRPFQDLEGIIGLFVNTLALRIQLNPQLTVEDYLKSVRESVLSAYAHQDTPFEKVVEAVQPERSLNRNPIFQVALSLQNAPKTEWELPNLAVSEEPAAREPSVFDLLLTVEESGEGLVGVLSFAMDLFERETITCWAAMLHFLLEQLTDRVPRRIAELRLLSDAQRRAVLEDFNATGTAFPRESSVQGLFQQWVRKTPQAIALRSPGRSLTYAELDALSNQLAHYLRQRGGVESGHHVPLLIARSPEMIVAQLAVLKCGATYVPLDVNIPFERQRFMIRDCGAHTVLADRAPDPSFDSQLLWLDWRQIKDALAECPTSDLADSSALRSALSPAYVMYTSGSTGVPKGVLIPHCGIIRLVINNQYAQLQPTDRIAHCSNPAFDASTFEVWAPLLHGATLVLVPQSTLLDVVQLRKLLRQEQVTILFLTTGLLSQYAQQLTGVLGQLRYLITGGDVADAQVMRQILTHDSPAHLLNAYGPTECTAYATTHEVRLEDTYAATIPIGRPISNTRIYILDGQGEPVPVGVAGEIHIAGAGVARGYLNRPELTQQRFLKDSFDPDSQARMYRTGDLGRWRADGTIDYLGRNDNQVKIRGFRIELGEIEAQLLRCQPIKEAVVIAREDLPGQKRLVAYVTTHEDRPLSVEAVRAELKGSLPEYMLPSALVTLPTLPLTPNGKLDRQGLPAPQSEAYARGHYEAPRTEVEEILAGIWQELLQVPRVGRQDNFFELGGHSLLIVQMMERLRRLNLAAEVRQVFESPTLADLARVLTRQVSPALEVPPNRIPPGSSHITPDMLPLVQLESEHIERIVRAVPGGAENIQDIYPLAPLQEGILFHHLLNTGGGDTYVLPTALKVASRARLDELIAALQSVIDRHDILRTAVQWEELPRPVQVVYRRATLPVENVVLDPAPEPLVQITERLQPQRLRLDLREAPLMRLQTATDPNSGEIYAFLLLHHIVCDHVTAEILISEIVARLERRPALTYAPVPCRNHVAHALAYAHTHDAEAYFRAKLGEVDEPTAPFGLLDVYGDGSRVEEAVQPLEESLSLGLRRTARNLSISAATLFHAAWGLVVAATSGRDDVVYGSVFLGRLQVASDSERAFGMFINTLPVRLRLKTVSARQLVTDTQQEMVGLLTHEQASLAVAQRCSGIAGATPLFTALLNYRHSVPNPEAEWGAAAGISVLTSQDWTNYPVTLSVDDLGEGFALTAQTDRRIDPQRMLGYMQAALTSLVQALEESPHTPALALSILPDSERQLLLHQFNATRAGFPQHSLVHELFEQQSERTPHAIAVLFEDRTLTYAELNHKANQLAHELRSRGVTRDNVVAICMERSLEMVIGILGTLKAGAAYLPLDPYYPHERLTYMLEDATPQVVLTQAHVKERVTGAAAQIIVLDADWSLIARHPGTHLDTDALGLTSRNLAYVIYTSGSTGKPKGAMNEHRALVNRLHWMQTAYSLTREDRVLQKTPFTFDVSVWEFLWTLTTGARLVIAKPEGHKDPTYLKSVIERAGISRLHFVPSMLQVFLEQHRPGECRSVRQIVCSGEELPAAVVRKCFEHFPEVQLSNLYGPTEAAIDVTAWECRPDAQESRIPIGRPISNIRMYLLDREGYPVPLGVAGEIHIGGIGVARGYLNRAALTAERFISDPFDADPQARLYKTGDLGVWRPDGAIEYLGRNDFQVKIRGFRIELGEIEAQLRSHPDINEAVVVAREDRTGEKRLVAYITARGPAGEPPPTTAKPSASDLRSHLKASLPDYMIPTAFVFLEQLPLSANGKLDRRALPAPEADSLASREYEPPRGDVEEILAGIWQALLGHERVGRQDNFFELGGHSLLIVQMMERLRRLGLATELRRVFESTTLAELASVLTRGAVPELEAPPNLIPSGCTAITPAMLPLVTLRSEDILTIEESVPASVANIQDIYPLAPLQEGILFHHLMSKTGMDSYAGATLLSVASRERVDELITALQHVIDRHDILRTAILWQNLPQPVQVVYRTARLVVEEFTPDIRDADALGRLNAEPRRFDLTRAPLIRLRIAPDPRTKQWLVWIESHHIIGDATSLKAVIGEIVAFLEGRQGTLPEPLPYRLHVAQALTHTQSHDAEAFFRRKLADLEQPTTPFGLMAEDSPLTETCELLDAAFSSRLRQQARRASVSVAALFHAAFALVVARATGRSDVVFGSVLLGRLQSTAAARNVLGMFINTLPLRLTLEGLSAKSLLERAQRELVELLSHEQASLALARRCSGITGSAPLFTALLNYRHSAPVADSDWESAAGLKLVSEHYQTHYPLTLSVDDLGEGFALTAQTTSGLNPERITTYMRASLAALADALEQAPQHPALSLPTLPAQERAQVLEEFNATAVPVAGRQLVHELFEQQVWRTPEALAVIHGDVTLSYTELNRSANRLARYLLAEGVGPDQVVGICLERSPTMVIALLAVLKAGGAYLPLDPNYPPERLAHMLHDAAPRVVLTQSELQGLLPDSPAQLIALDERLPRLHEHVAENLSATELALCPHHLVYLIYTSGSTGKPKGTAMPHQAMTNLLHWHRHTPGLAEPRRVLQFAALSFDVAFQETFSTLCTGGTLVLLDEWVRRDGRALLQLLQQQRIERVFLPPLMLQSLAECAQATGDSAPDLKEVITAGEPLRISPAIRQLLEQLPGCRLHNHYGPTETHVVTALTLSGPIAQWPPLPSIGKPISNLRIYILDGQGEPVPVGVAGEIHIAGAGVARGYLNRPELTQQRFLKDPFDPDPQARMYRTGDLGRWRADGTIDYLGRNDNQVKIRGFRIELGEIEAQLLRCQPIKEAVVIAREDLPGQKRLVAYVTTHEDRPLSVEAVRAELKGSLPEYMLPSALVTLPTLPLTPNGKLDRQGLPAPQSEAYARGHYEAPRTEVEEILAGIWQELLQVPRVGRQDNFFELGGHSLLIVQMMERLRRLNLAAEVRQVFESPTLADLARVLTRQVSPALEVPPNRIPPGSSHITPDMLPLVQLESEHIERIVRAVPGGAENIQDIYPLAPLQEGILFHHLLNTGGGDAYTRSILLSLTSRHELDRFARAAQTIVDRHDILRTAIFWERLPEPVQVVLRHATVPVEEFALDPAQDALEQLQQRMAPGRQRIDLRQAPLLRLQIAPDAHGPSWFALLQTHHIACDNQSLQILFSELVASFDGRVQSLPAPAPYRTHVAQALAHNRAHDAAAFFRSKLGAVDEPTALFGVLDVQGNGSGVELTTRLLDTHLAKRIRTQARRLGVSPAAVFHAAWGLVLARATARDDVVFGTVLLGRLQGTAGTQHTLGMFINTLPLRLQLQATTPRELLRRTQQELVSLLSYEQASLAMAQRCSALPTGTPLFNSILNYVHGAASFESGVPPSSGIKLLSGQGGTNYPILLSIDAREEMFSLEMESDRRIDATRLVGYLETTLESLVTALESSSESPVLTLTVLPERERRQIIEVFNATDAPYPQEKLIHELFEAQVRRTPHAPAVVYEDMSLTYAELNAKANQLARYLVGKGVCPDQLVAICLERSLEMVVGLLAILKAGGAYVPLDPAYPQGRLQYMLADAAPRVLLTQQKLLGALPAVVRETLPLDSEWRTIAKQDDSNLDLRTTGLTPRNLAYVIYTSGSTGNPKGAMNEHRGVVNRLSWMQSTYGLTARDRVLQKTPFSFDVSVWEFFWTLMTGARLIMARPGGHQDPTYLTRLIEKTGVSTLHFVPSMLQAFLDRHEGGECPSIRHIVCSGEELTAKTARSCMESFPQAQLSNLYGPTEAAVDVTAWECRRDDPSARVPIGHPISNLRIYVLDTSGQPVPLGVAGEIHIGGVGVGRGYYNRKELTQERFIPDPFSPDPHATLYKTGDLGRWRPDGAVEYLGRNDHQVKIRGFRIELGEIEAQLLRQESVKEAVVIAREDVPGDKRLVAYWVPRTPSRPEEAASAAALRTALKAAMPDYMVPSAFVPLERLPLTPNGKLDRRALPALDLSSLARPPYEPPNGPVEEALASLWEMVLKIPQVGRADNFFELGGHSLHAVKLISRIAERFGTTLPIIAVFQHPTIQQMAAVVGDPARASRNEGNSPGIQEEEEGVL